MKEKEIIEGNKLIAEFVGVEQMFDYKVSPPEPLPIYWVGYQIHESELDYDSDWSRLMPVVEKIESDFSNKFETLIYSNSCHIRSITGAGLDFMGTGKKIDAIYQAVVDFIKWYNQNKYHQRETIK